MELQARTWIAEAFLRDNSLAMVSVPNVINRAVLNAVDDNIEATLHRHKQPKEFACRDATIFVAPQPSRSISKSGDFLNQRQNNLKQKQLTVIYREERHKTQGGGWRSDETLKCCCEIKCIMLTMCRCRKCSLNSPGHRPAGVLNPHTLEVQA